MLRFATAPTGDMHINTLRVAIVNYLLSQQRKESFIIRIDDTDKAQNIEGKDTEIMQILEKFALTHDSVFHQSEHLHMHQTLAIRLLEEDKAFVCTCTDAQIQLDQENTKRNNTNYHYSGKCFDLNKEEHVKLKESGTPFVIRIKRPIQNIGYHDLIEGDILTTAEEVDSFVILNADGTPTYDFASACDDMIRGVNFILQEKDHLLNTAKQIHIKKQLGFDQESIYAHLPLLLNTVGVEMIKEDDTSLAKWLFAQGFIPDAIINYLLVIGNADMQEKIFTLPEAITWFSLEDISSAEAVFDLNKLRDINAAHLNRMDDIQLSSLFGFADADIGKLAKLYLQEASTIKELIAKIKPIFAPKNFEGEWGEEMRILEKVIQDAPMINNFDAFKAYLMKKSTLQEDHFITPLRLLLTGVTQGPELSDLYPLIKSYILEVAS